MSKKRFAVGDRVWYAYCQRESVEILCPTCFGKKKVTLILGNDDRVVLPCEACKKGYENPCGYIEAVVITGVTLETDDKGEKATYHWGVHVNYSDDGNGFFATKAEAVARSKELKQEYEEEQRTSANYIKENARESFAWNAQYHMRHAKKCREEAIRHEKKAQLCKARSRK